MLRVYTCNEWRAIRRDTSRLERSKGRGIVIHHTASANLGPLEEDLQERLRAFAVARGIQNFHVTKRRWMDSGQHFTISRGGVVLEGRRGSYSAAVNGLVVAGAHAGDERVNHTFWGIELEGTYTHEEPPEKLWKSAVELCAHLCFWGDVQSQEIHGHREYKATQCPGDVLFGLLPALRRAVHARKVQLMAGDD